MMYSSPLTGSVQPQMSDMMGASSGPSSIGVFRSIRVIFWVGNGPAVAKPSLAKSTRAAAGSAANTNASSRPNNTCGDRRQIRLEQIIKALGLHTVKVQLHPEVAVGITVNVARSTDEADQQAAMGRMVTETDREAAEDAAEAARHAAIEAVEAAETEAAEAEAAESEAAEAEAATETEDAGDVDETAKDA